MVRLAKKMKKNNVAVDIINFGEEAQNTAKLEAFINNVNNGDNRYVVDCCESVCVLIQNGVSSHLVSIPPGPHILSDMLLSTSILSGEEGAAAANFGSGGGGGGDFEFGVDPNLDPELALVCFLYYGVVGGGMKAIFVLMSLLGIAYFSGRRKGSPRS